MMVCECRKSACGNMCQCRILGLECTDLSKCFGSCNNETETNDIDSEIHDESDDNSKHSQVSDFQSAGSDKENIFRTFLLKSQNKHIKMLTNFLLISTSKFCQRFKLTG